MKYCSDEESFSHCVIMIVWSIGSIAQWISIIVSSIGATAHCFTKSELLVRALIVNYDSVKYWFDRPLFHYDSLKYWFDRSLFHYDTVKYWFNSSLFHYDIVKHWLDRWTFQYDRGLLLTVCVWWCYVLIPSLSCSSMIIKHWSIIVKWRTPTKSVSWDWVWEFLFSCSCALFVKL